ncbi:hypothetical protein [Luteolibacter sp. LG18]|uniref:hypothetical protein n=1 Tax=Luteolibacter sp. LG18 TaxID=2819286 RepID=UPI0030C77FD7
MDQAVIHTPRLRVRPEVVSRHPEFTDTLAEVGRFQVTRNEEAGSEWLNVKVGPGIGARLNVKQVRGDFHCNEIHLFTPHWIYGHNCGVIADHQTLLLALHRYHRVVSSLVEDGAEHRVLPGLGEDNDSHWQMVEFPMHVADPGFRLLRAFERISHDNIQGSPSVTPGYLVALNGTDLRIKAYDKVAQKSGARSVGPDPVLRIEVIWRESVLAGYLDAAQRGKEKAGRPWEPWAQGFSFETLYRAFRKVLLESRGVFIPMYPEEPTEKLSRVLAKVHSVTGLPLSQIEEMLRVEDGSKGGRTTRDNMKRIRELVARETRLQLEDFLPEGGVMDPPVIQLPREDAKFRKLQMSMGHIDPRIRQAYHDGNCRDSANWQPLPNDGAFLWTGPRGDKYFDHPTSQVAKGAPKESTRNRA